MWKKDWFDFAVVSVWFFIWSLLVLFVPMALL